MQNTFLSGYLLLGSFNTVLFLLILFATFFINKKMQQKKISFTLRMIVSIAMGLAIGGVIQLMAGFPDSVGKSSHLMVWALWKRIHGSS